MLLARLFESLPLVCPNCGADMRIIAFITDAAPIERMLNHTSRHARPRSPPPVDPAGLGGCPEAMPDWNLRGQPDPDLQFNQRIAW